MKKAIIIIIVTLVAGIFTNVQLTKSNEKRLYNIVSGNKCESFAINYANHAYYKKIHFKEDYWDGIKSPFIPFFKGLNPPKTYQSWKHFNKVGLKKCLREQKSYNDHKRIMDNANKILKATKKYKY